jgi:hypothetical protein
MVNLTLQATSARMLQKNKWPPAEIIIFHSSTSGDQIPMFQEFYIAATKSRLTEIYADKTPSITMVMINVKTSERFFTKGDNVRNVPAGTLVASEILTNYYDFYVVSQASNRVQRYPTQPLSIHLLRLQDRRGNVSGAHLLAMLQLRELDCFYQGAWNSPIRC